MSVTEIKHAEVLGRVMADHHRRFARTPASPEDFHTPVPAALDLAQVFRIETTRTVGHDCARAVAAHHLAS